MSSSEGLQAPTDDAPKIARQDFGVPISKPTDDDARILTRPKRRRVNP
jgi:hypothetical protein